MRVERDRRCEAERVLGRTRCESAANGSAVKVIQEFNVLNEHGCCHAIEQGCITLKGVGAAIRFEGIVAGECLSQGI